MSRRKRSRAAAVAAKHVALIPLASHDEDHEDEDDGCCIDCGQPWELCDCHVGAECGRWRNGVLSDSCSKAGSEECDFECPFSR